MIDSKVIAAATVAVGLVAGLGLLGAQISGSAEAFLNKDRIITVKGLAEKDVPANHVIWPLAITEFGNDLTTVYKTLESKQAIVRKFLTDGGITPEEITAAAPKVIDTISQTYGDNKKPYRWSITQVLTVSSKKVDQVRKLIQAQRDLIRSGVALSPDYDYLLQYSYTDLNEIKPGMIESATKNAREAAEKFAADSGSKLGKIKTANQGVFTISNRDETTPFIKNIRVVTTVQYFLKD